MRTSKLSCQTDNAAKVLTSARRSTRLSQKFDAPEVRVTKAVAKGEVPAAGIASPETKILAPKDDALLSPPAALPSRKRKRATDDTTPATPPRLKKTPTLNLERSPSKFVPILPSATNLRKLGLKVTESPDGDGTVEVHEPPHWREIYSTVTEMRKTRLAAVDTMGCEDAGKDSRTPKDKRLSCLIALMLSSQTKDTVNAVAMQNLRENLPGGLTLQALLDVTPERLNELIRAVGFHNNKTRFIKAAAQVLRDDFAGDIPHTVDGLVSLPGVGPKMAYLCMSAAWGKTEGIGVDVHVHRITNLWKWQKSKNPEETRMALESWLPRELWHDINHLLVGFGQTFCPPRGAKCGECRLSNGLCKSAVVDGKLVRGRRTVRVEEGETAKDEQGNDVKMEDGELVKGGQIGDIEDFGVKKE